MPSLFASLAIATTWAVILGTGANNSAKLLQEYTASAHHHCNIQTFSAAEAKALQSLCQEDPN